MPSPARSPSTRSAAHREHLAALESLRELITASPEGWGLALELGIAEEHQFIRFWSELLERERSAGRMSPHGLAEQVLG